MCCVRCALTASRASTRVASRALRSARCCRSFSGRSTSSAAPSMAEEKAARRRSNLPLSSCRSSSTCLVRDCLVQQSAVSSPRGNRYTRLLLWLRIRQPFLLLCELRPVVPRYQMPCDTCAEAVDSVVGCSYGACTCGFTHLVRLERPLLLLIRTMLHGPVCLAELR